MRTPRQLLKPLFALGLFAAFCVGCGYYLVPGPFQPLEVAEQQAAGEGTRMDVLDDGTVTFLLNRLEVSVRPMNDEELNRQYPAHSTDKHSPADELPTNPFTYGNWEYPLTKETPKRFSILKVSVKNYEFPKVKFDPLKCILTSANGRTYYPWGDYDFEEYFRRYPQAFNGLGYLRLTERRDIIRRALYPSDEFCFSGQVVEGYIVFDEIHNDVEAITFHIPEFGLRYNFRNEPVENIDLAFRFKRDVQKVRNYRDAVAAK